MTAVKLMLAISLALCSQLGFVHTLPPSVAFPDNNGIARLVFRSSISAADPMRPMACFSDYIANSNVISENYGRDYNVCVVNATNARNNIDALVATERKDIESRSFGVCGLMQMCNNLNATLDFLHCHSNIGSNNTRDAYFLSGNATEFARDFELKYNAIDTDYEECCSVAQRVYVAHTTHNYNVLQACLEGRATPKPPTATSTTTTTTTTTAPTSPPTESTASSSSSQEPSPSSDGPEITDAPNGNSSEQPPQPEQPEQPSQEQPQNPEQPDQPLQPDQPDLREQFAKLINILN